MTGFFDFSEPPLSTLDAGERQRLRQAVDVARFQQNEVLRESGEQWSHMYLVLRGRVEAQAQDESGQPRTVNRKNRAAQAEEWPRDRGSRATPSRPSFRTSASFR